MSAPSGGRARVAGMDDAAGLNFALPDEIRMLRDNVRKFVDRELIPIEREARDGHRLKPDVRAHLEAKAKDLGLAGYDVPREYGGLGMGLVAKVTVRAEHVGAARRQRDAAGKLGPHRRVRPERQSDP